MYIYVYIKPDKILHIKILINLRVKKLNQFFKLQFIRKEITANKKEVRC